MNKTIPLTPQGFEDIKAEWNDLKNVQRPTIQESVTFAAAQGDRSENADYTFGKMKLRDIDKRLRYLDKVLEHCVVIHEVNPDAGIRFGAIVKLKNKSTQKEVCYTIVGAQEMDPLEGKITMTSPIGKSLIGKKCGELVEVQSPKGILLFEVMDIQ